ncbi:cyclophilin B [Pelomyxa schiedti]|nr:cyclophilin B [Pelomyxa schiedti]
MSKTTNSSSNSCSSAPVMGPVSRWSLLRTNLGPLGKHIGTGNSSSNTNNAASVGPTTPTTTATTTPGSTSTCSSKECSMASCFPTYPLPTSSCRSCGSSSSSPPPSSPPPTSVVFPTPEARDHATKQQAADDQGDPGGATRSRARSRSTPDAYEGAVPPNMALKQQQQQEQEQQGPPQLQQLRTSGISNTPPASPSPSHPSSASPSPSRSPVTSSWLSSSPNTTGVHSPASPTFQRTRLGCLLGNNSSPPGGPSPSSASSTQLAVEQSSRITPENAVLEPILKQDLLGPSSESAQTTQQAQCEAQQSNGITQQQLAMLHILQLQQLQQLQQIQQQLQDQEQLMIIQQLLQYYQQVQTLQLKLHQQRFASALPDCDPSLSFSGEMPSLPTASMSMSLPESSGLSSLFINSTQKENLSSSFNATSTTPTSPVQRDYRFSTGVGVGIAGLVGTIGTSSATEVIVSRRACALNKSGYVGGECCLHETVDLAAERMLHEIRHIESDVSYYATLKEQLRVKLREAEHEEIKRVALLLCKKADLRRTLELPRLIFNTPIHQSLITTISDPYFPLTDALPQRFVSQHSFTPECCVILNNAQEPDKIRKHGEVLSALTVSTYPMDLKANLQVGSPICDCYTACLCPAGSAFISIADGCNWGAKPREAACRASSAFVNYLLENYIFRNDSDLHKTSVREYGALMLQALAHAHNSIVIDKKEKSEVGTTTLLGIALVPLKLDFTEEPPSLDPKWACIALSIGDCKAFRWSTKDKQIYEISTGNRETLDATDPGGRLGPYLESGSPDLRNLSFFYTTFDKGDLLICMSDGVHDNIDPASLGIEPSALCTTLGPTTWDTLASTNPQMFTQLREQFMTRKLCELVCGGGGHPGPTEGIVQRIIQHCINLTAGSRQWMEEHPNRRLPKDYTQFPGKLDHTTCVALYIQPDW